MDVDCGRTDKAKKVVGFWLEVGWSVIGRCHFCVLALGHEGFYFNEDEVSLVESFNFVCPERDSRVLRGTLSCEERVHFAMPRGCSFKMADEGARLYT